MSNKEIKKLRERFKFHTEWYESLKPFSLEERGTLFDAILSYGFRGEEKELPTHLKAVFEFLKYQINQSLESEKVSLYVIKLYDACESFYKIGISSNIKKRIQSFTNLGYDEVTLNDLSVTFDNREQALLYEKALLEKLELFRYTPEKKFGGRTECFCCHTGDCIESISGFIKELNKSI